MNEEHTTEAGPAVLELGRDIGAAVIYTTAARAGAEIEIRPHGAQWDGTHTAVRKRPGPSPVFAALFFNLRAGGYEVRLRGGESSRSMDVVGGRVTEDRLT